MIDEEILIEPEHEPIEIEPEPETEPEKEATETTSAQPSHIALMQVLPADFPLPTLIRFIPRAELREAAERAIAYALAIDVKEHEGLHRADVAVTALRGALQVIEAEFAEPVSLAYDLHKRLTTLRGEWLAAGQAAVKTVGSRIYNEKVRLENLEREARRKAQEEADRAERERIRKEREAAEKAKAPAPVVEQLKQQEKTATAPPVQAAAPAPTLKGVSTVTTWKARIAGTPACDVPLPDIEALSPAQRLEVLKLLKAIVDGRAPMAAITLNDSYLNKRAKADKSTLAIPGIESFEEGSVRARGSRAK